MLTSIIQCDECCNTDDSQLVLIYNCAHVVCKIHIDNFLHCPVCNSTDISSAPMNNLPSECKEYFVSTTETLNELAQIVHFQQNRMANIVSKQQLEVSRLNNKVEEQQQVMRSVREELVQARELQKEVESLRERLAEYQDASNTSNNTNNTNNTTNSPGTRYHNNHIIPKNQAQESTLQISPFKKTSQLSRSNNPSSPFQKPNNKYNNSNNEDMIKSLAKFHPPPKKLTDSPSPNSQSKLPNRYNQPHPFQQLNRKIRTTSSHHSNIVSSSGSVTKRHPQSSRAFLNRVSSPTFKPPK